MTRLVALLTEDGARKTWVFALFLAALVIRIHWNVFVHPIGEFLYSDMSGYDGRADALVEDPWKDREYFAFFPWGATYWFAAIKFCFGLENYAAIGVAQAVLGALIVVMVFDTTRRLGGPSWTAPAAGLLATIYYPLISIGGYVLSELPFSFCLTAATWSLVRLVDSGRRSDAILTGVFAALGIVTRPQIFITLGVFALWWLVCRKHVPRVTLSHLAWFLVPVAFVLGYSSYRHHYHTERFGLVSDNGTVNLVFGRCHAKGIYSRPDAAGHGTVRFAPPPLIQLERHSHGDPDSFIQLAPVYGREGIPAPEGVEGFVVDGFGCRKRTCRTPGAELEYRGYIGDGAAQRRIVFACMRHGGLRLQAYYSLVHVVQLWSYNLMWPDQANPKPRSSVDSERWSSLQQRWARIHRVLLLPAALVGLCFAFVPRRPKSAVVALVVWSVLLLAIVWLGGQRFRVPYDPCIIILAVWVYGAVHDLVLRRFLRDEATTP